MPSALHRRIDDDNTDTEIAGTNKTRARKHSEFLTQLKDVHELVRVHLARAQTTQARHYNLRRRDWRCRLGDRVMKRGHILSSAGKAVAAKLAPKFDGPYTVIKVHSPVVYDLKAEDGKRLHRVHVKDLKPFS